MVKAGVVRTDGGEAAAGGENGKGAGELLAEGELHSGDEDGAELHAGGEAADKLQAGGEAAAMLRAGGKDSAELGEGGEAASEVGEGSRVAGKTEAGGQVVLACLWSASRASRASTSRVLISSSILITLECSASSKESHSSTMASVTMLTLSGSSQVRNWI